MHESTLSESTLSIDELLDQASWLHRLARGLARDASEADEVVQDTWLAALRNPPDRRGPPRPWLRSVLQNALRMRRRASSRRALREEQCREQSDREQPPSAPSPEEWAQRLELQQKLVEMVSSLREPQRSTLLLHYYEELPAAEIARLQGVPASTVRWRLQSAIATLRGELDDAYGERAVWLRAIAPLAAGVEGAGAGGGVGEATAGQPDSQAQGSSASPYVLAALFAGAIGISLAVAVLPTSEASEEASAASSESSLSAGEPGAQGQVGEVPGLGLHSSAAGSTNPRPLWMGELLLEGQVVDVDGIPVEGAEVSLIGAGPMLTTRSAADGTFSFDGLEEKSYTLSAKAPGLAGGPVDHPLTATSGPAVLWLGPSSTLELTVLAGESGEPLPEARAALSGEVRHADAGGRITFEGVLGGAHLLEISCEGRVPVTRSWVAPTGPAIALASEVELEQGFEVSGRVVLRDGSSRQPPVTTLWVREVSSGRRREVRNAVDAATGTFEVVVPAATIQIEASTRYGSALQGTSGVLEVASALRDVEIPLEPIPAVTLEGTVLDEGGSPAPYAQVFASHEEAMDPDPIWTDDAGRFRLPVEAGDVSLWAISRDGGFPSMGAPRSEPKKVQVGAGRAEEITLRLRPAEVRTLSGVVVDRAGSPVAEAQVFFEAFAPVPGARQILSVPTDPEGRFALQVPAGEVELWASRVGLGEQALSLFPGKKVAAHAAEVTLELLSTCGLRGRIDPRGPVPEVLDLRVGRRGPTHVVPVKHGGFELDGLPCGEQELYVPGAAYRHRGPHIATLRPGDAYGLGTIAMAGGEVSGVVVDEFGEPVQGARVEFLPAGASERKGPRGSRADAPAPLVSSGKAATTSDAAGRFHLAGISGGYVVADHPASGRSAAAPAPTAGSAPELRLTVRRTGTLRGTLRGAISIRARPIVTAACPEDGGERAVEVGLDGTYQLDRLRPCRYRVSVRSAAGEELASGQVDVRSADTSTLDLTLTPRGG